MSKTDTSSLLVGVLRFDAPSSSTRTLSATQAYDTSRSQVVLGNFTGKLTDKTATEKDDIHPLDGDPWGVSLTATQYGDAITPFGAKPANLKQVSSVARNVNTVSLNAVALGISRDGEVRSGKAAIPCGCNVTGYPCPNKAPCAPDGVTFVGTAVGSPINVDLGGSSSNSKATNANTTYYGAITVGLGEYKKWQGNYAVLKINTVTEKAILRIYAV